MTTSETIKHVKSLRDIVSIPLSFRLQLADYAEQIETKKQTQCTVTNEDVEGVYDLS